VRLRPADQDPHLAIALMAPVTCMAAATKDAPAVVQMHKLRGIPGLCSVMLIISVLVVLPAVLCRCVTPQTERQERKK
jgi:hypothetical protein